MEVVAEGPGRGGYGAMPEWRCSCAWPLFAAPCSTQPGWELVAKLAQIVSWIAHWVLDFVWRCPRKNKSNHQREEKMELLVHVLRLRKQHLKLWKGSVSFCPSKSLPTKAWKHVKIIGWATTKQALKIAVRFRGTLAIIEQHFWSVFGAGFRRETEKLATCTGSCNSNCRPRKVSRAQLLWKMRFSDISRFERTFIKTVWYGAARASSSPCVSVFRTSPPELGPKKPTPPTNAKNDFISKTSVHWGFPALVEFHSNTLTLQTVLYFNWITFFFLCRWRLTATVLEAIIRRVPGWKGEHGRKEQILQWRVPCHHQLFQGDFLFIPQPRHHILVPNRATLSSATTMPCHFVHHKDQPLEWQIFE